MSKVYRVTPLEKKSVYYRAEMFRNNADGSLSWFNVEDHYRWGQGFIDEDLDVNLPYDGDHEAYCDPNSGWGAELDDQVGCFFEFSEDISEAEQEEIKDLYYNGGIGWLFEGGHNWELEIDNIIVLAPYQVDLCDMDGTVIQENIKLRNKAI